MFYFDTLFVIRQLGFKMAAIIRNSGIEKKLVIYTCISRVIEVTGLKLYIKY